MDTMSSRFIALALFVAAGLYCGGKNEDGPLAREKVIDIAAHHLMGKSFDTEPPSTIRFKDGRYTVDFRYQVPGFIAGEMYIQRVVFDGKTGELERLEMREDVDEVMYVDSLDLLGRPTPLNEEDDREVESVKQQVLDAVRKASWKK